jgi:ketosteroid isomerase-like protein
MTIRTCASAAALILTMCAAGFSAGAQAPAPDAEVIAVERAALDRWGKGDPDGFLTTYAPEVTYFDPLQERRLDGIKAMTDFIAPFRGKVRVDRYDMINPTVQRYGDVAVLSYNLTSYQKQPDGTERVTTRWNSTAVFRRIDGKWRTIHSHWSYTRPELKTAASLP